MSKRPGPTAGVTTRLLLGGLIVLPPLAPEAFAGGAVQQPYPVTGSEFFDEFADRISGSCGCDARHRIRTEENVLIGRDL